MAITSSPTYAASGPAQVIPTAARTYWGMVWRRFTRHRVAMGAALALGVLVMIVAASPLFITPDQANLAEPSQILRPPSAQHWFGTDDVGRDILARALYGGRVSLLIGGLAAALSVVLGTLVGILAGYYRGWVDVLLMRLTDAMLSMPSLLLLIVLGRIFGASILVLTLVIAG